jgi:NPCBM-associated, NEW3 domain of alpha-galactosidase
MSTSSMRHALLTKVNAVLRQAVALLLVLSCSGQSLRATDVVIGGVLGTDPLQITSDEFMNMRVYRNQSGTYVRQYYTTYQTYLRLSVGPVVDRTVYVSSTNGSAPYNYTPVTHSSPDASTIQTTVTTANNVSIQHTVTYATGDEFYRHQWVVSNNGTTTYSNVALRYGGDTYFGGNDRGPGYYDDNLGMIFGRSEVATGLAGIFGAPESPATGWYADEYGIVVDALAGLADLPNTANGNVTDNGMGLEWVHPTDLAPGQSFTITAYEKWTESGTIQVLAPAPLAAVAGQSLNIAFTVTNLQTTSDVVELAATAPSGWQPSVVSSLQIAANSSVAVSVGVTIPSDAGGVGQVTLTLSKRDPQPPNAILFTNSDAVDVTVSGEAPFSVTSPVVQLSTAERTIYTAVSPSTTEGADSLLAALAGRSTTTTRAFAWNSLNGRYVEIPNEISLLPLGALERETGIFIATRVALSYNLSGTPVDATYTPYQLQIPPGADVVGVPTGWTFAGIPPIKIDSTTVVSDFAWPTDTAPPAAQALPATALVILVNNEPASDADIIQLMGDPASPTVDSSRPWWWDNELGAYRQVAQLRSGEAYWFKNNSTTVDVAIQVSASQRQQLFSAASATDKSGASKFKGITNRGAPPTLPGATSGSGNNGSGGSAGSGASSKASSGGGCGAGSGLGLLSIMFLLSFVGLRLFVARR